MTYLFRLYQHSLIASVFWLSPVLLCAQTAKGDKEFEKGNYYKALIYYENAVSANSENAEANAKLGGVYMLMGENKKALKFLNDALKYTPEPDIKLYDALARAYHLNNRFSDAKKYYTLSDPNRVNWKEISKKIQECEYGEQYVAKPVKCKISNMGPGINTAEHEYLPKITADQMVMYFTSRRQGSTGGKEAPDGMYYEDIYRSVNKGGAWSMPKNIGSPVNTDDHDACVGLSDDGQTMFIYRGTGGGDLYMSELKGDKWKKPVPLSINTQFFESSASLAPDDRTLYFVKNSGGNKDIYYCKRTATGLWSKPIPLQQINTPYDEESPYMHPDGKTLFFSSKGHSSMGGYDIFKTERKSDGTWTTPENLGYPINSAGDDVYFVLAANGKFGYYSSEKEGGYGKQDLYTLRFEENFFRPCLALLTGKITDEFTTRPIEAAIEITDNKTGETIANFHSNALTGEYLIALPSETDYGIRVNVNDRLFFSDHVHLSCRDGYREQVKNIQLITAKPGAKVVLKNIFFDSGKSELKPESKTELLRLADILKKNNALIIEISGHTDNTGDARANMQLSQLRAEAVRDHLVKLGISPERMKARGYGITSPIASNSTEEGRAENRRTEFMIISGQ